jgi:Ca2+-binding EF-hand superfamily protein
MTRKLNLRTAVALMLSMGVSLATGVQAQSRPDPQQIAAKFQAADKNQDGKLTLEEAKAGMPRVAKVFSKIDVENKGYVTLEQIQAFVANR